MSRDNFNESGDLKAQVEAFKITQDTIQNQSMQLAFIEIEKTELGVKKEELELVAPFRKATSKCQ